MGVEARIVLHAADRAHAERAVEAAFGAIARLESVMSDWSATSELAHVVATAADGPIPVSDDFFDVLERALDISRRTEGAFDPTVAPLVRLWRSARATQCLPSAAQIRAARARVGIERLELDPRARTVRFTEPGVELDFGAIGKGYACQRALEVLTRAGIESALVEMGGDLVCSKAPPGRAGWRIDLESEGLSLIVAHRAVSTSGDREQWVEIGGRRYSHVLDPRTGFGLETRARAIVVASDGAVSDAVATAISVRGGADGIALAARFPDLEARLEETDAGERVVRSTNGFARFLEK